MMKTLSPLGEITFPVTLTLEDLERVLTWPTWGYFRELIESAGRKLLSYILELMDQQSRWEDYLQAWGQFRRDYDFYIDYSTRSLDHHGIWMQPFVLGASTEGLRIHFLWRTVQRKELIELMLQESWATGKPRGLLHRSRTDLTLAEIEERIEWIWRKTMGWSRRSDPRGAGERPR
jgi:hypothetical protein